MPLVSSWRSGYLAATRSSAAPFTVPSHIAPTAHLKPAQSECLRKVIARQGTIQSSPARKRRSGDFGISNCRQPKSSTGDLAARGRRGARFPKTTSFGSATPNPISNCGSRLQQDLRLGRSSETSPGVGDIVCLFITRLDAAMRGRAIKGEAP